jgi:hypothetical protein
MIKINTCETGTQLIEHIKDHDIKIGNLGPGFPLVKTTYYHKNEQQYKHGQ